MTSISRPDQARSELNHARRRISELESEVRVLRLSLDVSGTIDLRTGMANRNGMIDAIHERRRWLQRTGEPFSVMLTAFPASADGAHVAGLLQAGVRAIDRMASWDEWVFGAVLPGLTEDGFEAVASRLRRTLLLARVMPERVVFGVPRGAPADQVLRALEAGSDISQGLKICIL